MWIVLIVGAYVTVGFTYLFGFDQTSMQQLMIGGLSFLIGLVLFLIVALDYPFRGSIAVQPEAFRSARSRALTRSVAYRPQRADAVRVEKRAASPGALGLAKRAPKAVGVEYDLARDRFRRRATRAVRAATRKALRATRRARDCGAGGCLRSR